MGDKRRGFAFPMVAVIHRVTRNQPVNNREIAVFFEAVWHLA